MPRVTAVITALEPPIDDLPAWSRRVAEALDAGTALPEHDLHRALVATELAFASSRLGGAIDWNDDTGYRDREAIVLLRDIQEQHHYGQAATAFEPAWAPMLDGEDRAVWAGFDARFHFRASIYPSHWPGIDEPAPSVTFDLSGMHRPSRWVLNEPEAAPSSVYDARIDLLNAMALTAFTEIVPDGTRLAVLDWQHQCHWFRPDLQVHRGGPWKLSVFPDGDYYIFLTEDLTAGTFGHPWEQTLCVFGEPLMTTLVPLLTGWLPITRDHR